jgi:hypothetical protein
LRSFRASGSTESASVSMGCPALAHTPIEADWLSSLITGASGIEAPNEGCIDPVRLSCGRKVWSARGQISAHGSVSV